MKREITAWTGAFLFMSAAAVALLASGPRESTLNLKEGEVILRDPTKVTDAQLDAILDRIRKGDVAAGRGDVKSARIEWDAATEQGRGLWPIHEGLGDSYVRYAMLDDAWREYVTAETLAAELPPRLASLKLKRSNIALKQERWADALTLMVEVARPDTLAQQILDVVAKSDALLDQLAGRAEIQDARLWRIVAGARAAKKDDVGAAIAMGRYARGVAPWDATLNRRAIEALRAQKKYDDALLVCRAWSKAAPEDMNAYEMMGDLLTETGKPDEALLAYTSIVDIRGGEADAHRQLGVIFRRLGKYDESIRQFESAMKLRGEEPFWFQEIAATLVAKGELDAANAKYEEMLKKKWDSRFGDVGAQIRPKFAEMYQKRIDEARKAGSPDVVRDLRRRAAELGLHETGAFDIKVVMTWDTRIDIDLDVTEPQGETINHGQAASKQGGKYYYDNTQAFGPEHYTLLKAGHGIYRVGAHSHGTTKTTVKFEMILYEGLPNEKRWTDSLVLDEKTTQAWLKPFDITRP